MFAILFEVLITVLGAALAAGALAWLSWTLLNRTRFPGLGPILAFAILAVLRNAGDFTQALLIASGIFAVAALATMFATMTETRRRGKPMAPRRPFWTALVAFGAIGPFTAAEKGTRRF